MNYASIKYCDIANGPGVRTSLFVSGCTHHCKGCFNEMTWDFAYGDPFTEQVAEEILHSIEPDYIHGVFGEKFLKFRAKLGGKRFVVRQNQRRAVHLRNDICHGKGFARTRYTEQSLFHIPFS